MDDHTQDGGAEEVCSSCESGWTDYFVSPTNSADDDMADYNNNSDIGVGGGGGGGGGGEAHRGKDIRNNQKGSDNDSLASDASSGPSHRKRPGKSSSRRCANADEGEESGFDGRATSRSRNSSGCSYKMGFNRVKKERSADRKANSHKEVANPSALYGQRGDSRRKK